METRRSNSSVFLARVRPLGLASSTLSLSNGWKEPQSLHEELGWESLNDRRWSRRLVLFFKFINELAPEYTRHPIPRIRWSNYALRNQAVVGRINARTERFGSSFYPNCLKEWESLVLRSGNYLQ